jgi:RHS repeat-associated protein
LCLFLFEVTALYYDKYGRVVQTRATNHLGGYDLVYNELKFTGAPARTLKTHNIAGQASVVELYTYDYDKAQRPTTTTYSLNGGSLVTLTSKTYDDLGRVSTNTRHNGTDPQNYAYNIRSWPTKITSGSFEENLYYNKDVPSGTTANYNGNIAYSTWTYNGVNKGYSYVYDGLNRLTSASFKQGSSSQANGSFDENYSFDKMGNILTLQRKSNNTLVDDLTLHYANGEKSNQIDWITDGRSTQGLNDTKEYQDISKATSSEFVYDVNGNMIKDLDRDIYTIKYNVLNLPDAIQFKNGNQIKNTYDASGHKLGTEYFTWRPGANAPVVNAGDILNISYSQTSTDQNGTAYIGNIEYNTLNGNTSLTTLSRIYNDEGYVENPANPQYYYFRHDHLGDNREVWLANTGETVQRTQYYPSGLPWAYNRTVDHPDLQHRRYNGKEFVEMHGYDTYDIVWRQYYPAIMRFQTPDPEVENDYDLSPYTMCDNNMVLKTDPDGRVAIVDNIAGAFIGGLADYGGQVISNYAQGSAHPFTQNINLVSIGTSMAVGALTSGVSAFAKGGATVLASAVNNSVAIKTTGSGLKVEVQKDPVNILKNTAIDLTTDKLAKGLSSKLVGAPLSKVGTTNAGRLNSTGKALVNATGNNVTRKTTETTKRIIKTVAKAAKEGTNTTLKGVTDNKRQELKDKTDQKK